MSEQQLTEWKKASIDGTMKDDENPIFIFNTTGTDLLVRMLSGDIDAQELIKSELSNRGLNEEGKFIGF